MLLAGARHFGPADWGVFWAAFILAQIMARMLDLGTHLAMARDSSISAASARLALRRSLAAKLLLGAIFIPLSLAAVPLIGLPLVLASLLILAHLLLSFIEWIGHYLRGHGLVLHESVVLALDCLLAFIFGLAAIFLDSGLAGFAFSQVAAHAIGLGAAWAVARASVPFHPGLTTGGLSDFSQASFPIGFTLLAPLGSSRVGVLALASYGPAGAAAAGLFSAAHRLLDAARFAPLAAAAAAFPSFTGGFRKSGPWPTLSILLPAASLGAAALAAEPVASRVIVLLFGDSFSAAQPLFSILIWCFPLITASAIAGHWLVARGDEKFAAWLSVSHVAAHVAALAILVPSRGAAGAAWALLAAEGALAAAMLLRLPFIGRLRRKGGFATRRA